MGMEGAAVGIKGGGGTCDMERVRRNRGRQKQTVGGEGREAAAGR